MIEFETLTLLPPEEAWQPGPTAFRGSDTERLYRHSVKTQPPEWPWRDRPVHYTMNSLGYRGPEFTPDLLNSSTWLLGCSWAYGVGVDDRETIGHYLSEILGHPVANLSQGGTSIGWTCDQLTMLLRQGLRPLNIAVIWTEPTRVAWWGSQGPDQPRLKHQLSRAHSEDELHSDHRAWLDIQCFRQRAQLMGVSLAEVTWNLRVQAITSVTGLLQIDTARDLQHPGPNSNKEAAKILAQLLDRE